MPVKTAWTDDEVAAYIDACRRLFGADREAFIDMLLGRRVMLGRTCDPCAHRSDRSARNRRVYYDPDDAGEDLD
jgi:hypothetical protein